jgi:hypothetical protein
MIIWNDGRLSFFNMNADGVVCCLSMSLLLLIAMLYKKGQKQAKKRLWVRPWKKRRKDAGWRITT